MNYLSSLDIFPKFLNKEIGKKFFYTKLRTGEPIWESLILKSVLYSIKVQKIQITLII
jgi:hypothetical protein